MSSIRSDTSSGLDPFVLGPDHHKHINSSRVVHLEDTGKTFCPLCIEQLDETASYSDAFHDRYVRNLFEALDEHYHSDGIRKIVLPMLEIVMRARPIKIKTDEDFHNLLRIIRKTLKSCKFGESYLIASIFSETVVNNNNSSIPLLSVWKTTQQVLEICREHVEAKYYSSTTDLTLLLRGVLLLIKSYLKVMSKFSVHQLSDIIFPLHENDQVHSRKYYLETQKECISIMESMWLPLCWPRLNTNGSDLNIEEIPLVEDLLDCIQVCYKKSLKLGHKSFAETIKRRDILYPTYLLIQKYETETLKSKLQSFLGRYVLNQVRYEFKTDINLGDYFQLPEDVECNHRNAISHSTETENKKKTLFYLLLNYVAYRQNSNYFNHIRFRRVLKNIRPKEIGVSDSPAFSKIYNYLVASQTMKVSSLDNVHEYFTQMWTSAESKLDTSELEASFCFNPKVFLWASGNSEFCLLAKESTIRKVIEVSMSQKITATTMVSLLKNSTYRRLVCLFLKNDELAAEATEELLGTKCRFSEEHRDLATQFSAILPAQLHHTILQYINGANERLSLNRIRRLSHLVNLWLEKCEHFRIIFDHQYLIDLFRFMEYLFRPNQLLDSSDVLVNLTRMLTSLMKPSRNLHLMLMLKHLNRTVLGLMYQQLADYVGHDLLGESIARMMIAYDEIDFPLVHRIEKDLGHMSLSILNWMFSHSQDLHKLSLRAAISVLSRSNDEINPPGACVSTGIAHMLLNDPEFFKDKENMRLFHELSRAPQLEFNPLMDYVINEADYSFDVIQGSVWKKGEFRSLSPTLSFCSETSDMGVEEAAISRILNRLNDEDEVPHSETSFRIPEFTYASVAVDDQFKHNVDYSGWEKFAHEKITHIHELESS